MLVHLSEADKVLTIFDLRGIGICVNKLSNFVRVHIIRISRLVFVVTGHVFRNIFRVRCVRFASEDACPLAVKQLAAFVITLARVAKVRAFEHVSLFAVSSFGAVAQEAKCFAYGGTGASFGMSKGTLSLGTIPFGIVQTVRYPLGGHIVG